MKKLIRVFYPGQGLGNFPDFLRAHLGQADKPVKVTVEPHAPPKTMAQLGYFHGVVVPTIASEKGVLAWRVREALKQEFLPQVPSLIDPNKWHTKSMADLTRAETSDFIEQCLAWAANEGIYIPGPHERAA